jgi:endoglucanase
MRTRESTAWYVIAMAAMTLAGCGGGTSTDSPAATAQQQTFKLAVASPAPSPTAPTSAPPPLCNPMPCVQQVHAAAPGVLVVTVMTGPRNEAGGVATTVDALNLDAAAWRVNGTPATGINRYSLPFDELRPIPYPEPGWRTPYPVIVEHRIYLRLNAPMRDGDTYSVATPYGNRQIVFGNRSTFCESIKVNQVGYSKRATSRYANYGVFMGDGGTVSFGTLPGYQVIRENNGQVVHSGTAADMGRDAGTAIKNSGEHVYRLRLDNVPEGGPYFVSIPGCGRSRSFGIGDEYTRKAAYVITRGLYHQRCGIALERPHTEHTRGICHTTVADIRKPWADGFITDIPASTPVIPMRGGYHDAGDFDRRPYHALIPLSMLSYYEAFPGNFVDGQYNIPESGNRIPDFLDEALWGLSLWENLQVMERGSRDYGGVRTGTEKHNHPGYGPHSAANDPSHPNYKTPGVYGTFGVRGAASTKPDAAARAAETARNDETALRVTAYSAGMFAHASRLVRPFDAARADRLMERARLAWGYLTRESNVNARKEFNMYAALQLYLATGEVQYHDIFRTLAPPMIVTGNAWPDVYMPGNGSAAVKTMHFSSYLLPHGRPADSALAQSLKDAIFKVADTQHYMGPAPEGQPYPQGVTKFMGWGTGSSQGLYAEAYMFAWRLSTDAAKKQRYVNAVSQYADYSLGLNPMNMSYYTGLGVDQPWSPLQLDSYFTKYGVSDGVTSDHVGKPKGNVPGILVYGTTDGRSGYDYQTAVTNKMYPKFDELPGLRRYAQGWSAINNNEFDILQQVWNVTMIGFLYEAGSDPGAVPSGGSGSGGSAPPPPPPPPPPAAFPTTDVLDDFNRDNGAIGSNWSGGSNALAGTTVVDSTATSSGGPISWGRPFGANQEVFVTLSTVDLQSWGMTLMLKSGNPNWHNGGAIHVLYLPREKQLKVKTFHPNQGWVQHGGAVSTSLVAGDDLGASATSDGKVVVYRNGTAIGDWNITSWPNNANGGYIGVAIGNMRLDDFGGGEVGSRTPR